MACIIENINSYGDISLGVDKQVFDSEGFCFKAPNCLAKSVRGALSFNSEYYVHIGPSSKAFNPSCFCNAAVPKCEHEEKEHVCSETTNFDK